MLCCLINDTFICLEGFELVFVEVNHILYLLEMSLTHLGLIQAIRAFNMFFWQIGASIKTAFRIVNVHLLCAR